MSEYGMLTANVRAANGKGPSRRLRQEGKIPGVLYGGGKDNLSLAVDPRGLQRAMDPKLRYNTLFNLTIRQEGHADVTETCLIADYDMNVVRDEIIHVDFVRVQPGGDIERQVPVVYSGRAAGVAMGGKLKTFRRKVRVSAPAGSIPAALEVDVTLLQAGRYIRVKDVSIAGARILESPEQALAFVGLPKAEQAPEEAKPEEKKEEKKEEKEKK